MIAIPIKVLRARAKQMASQEAPEFMQAILQAKTEGAEIDLSLKTFPGDAELLYLCLWLAYDEGIHVRCTPAQRRAKTIKQA
ncbi:MAG: hypothetical protein NT023_16560 [Armatimonadetes bacterium]|nr:hypothetical protein [Armatimonadota bacterium]